ncbi:hypothetical protein GW7_02983, partial [Heterocephalus glaber]
RSSCLSLPSAGITGVHHHAQLLFAFFTLILSRMRIIMNLRQPGLHSKFKGSLDYTVRPCLKKT